MKQQMNINHIAIMLVTTTMLFGCSKPEDASIATDVAKIRQIKEAEEARTKAGNQSTQEFAESIRKGAAAPIRQIK